MRRFAATLSLLFSFLLSACAAAPSSRSTPSHLDAARELVREVAPADTLYQHNPTVVRWQENGASAVCRADCSGFLNEVLKRTYRLSDADLKAWLRSERPLAMHYHIAIGASRGFTRIERIADVREGDVIATRYEPGAGNSGHAMIVDAPPIAELRAAAEPGGDFLPRDAVVWRVPVIDASRTGHGPGDSRFQGEKRIRNGLGQGFFRIATDAAGKVVAHAFGTGATDAWHAVSQRPLAIGRITPPFPSSAVREGRPTAREQPALTD